MVTHFGEKRQADAGWINGGFFVLEPEVKLEILSDTEPFETGALPRLVHAGELSAFEHSDFWQPMDTLREKNELSALVKLPTPPWLIL
jgi:glucose-1-phosphate cytidylyltransferase